MPLRTLQDEKSNPEKKIGIKVSAFVPQELGTTQHNSEIEEKGTTQINDFVAYNKNQKKA